MSGGGSRIVTLDAVRGAAVMGILLMNIQSFAMPEAAYVNPRAYGGASGANLILWCAEFVFVDAKMRGLFSWLFGASLLLVAERADGAGASAAHVNYRRMAWLLLFGLAHLVLVWDGDILSHYALVGSVAFLFRHKPTHALVTAAILLLIAQVVLVVPVPMSIDAALVASRAGHSGGFAGQMLPVWREQFGVPSRESIAAALALYRGSYAALLASRVAETPRLVLATLWAVGLETLGFMLLGMAALKSGLLTGAWSRTAYRRAARLGFGIGVPPMMLIAGWLVWRGFDLSAVAWATLVLTPIWRPAMIAGWASLLVLLLGRGGRCADRIAAAGRMAFSNYLGTSLICAGLFDGLALFGRFERAQLLGFVAAIWTLMLWWSPPWLGRFRYGPLEWLWRSLARGECQPMRRAT